MMVTHSGPRTVSADATAEHEETLLVSESCRIELPPSDAKDPLRAVTIVATRTDLRIAVVARRGELVMGAHEELLPGAVGLRRYIDDGQGGWWREVVEGDAGEARRALMH